MLLAQGITPQCGARLAHGPSPHSRCATKGRMTLHQLLLGAPLREELLCLPGGEAAAPHGPDGIERLWLLKAAAYRELAPACEAEQGRPTRAAL